MLRRCTILLYVFVATAAVAAPPRDRLRLPERLTAGSADQFLGVLSPDGKRLYFVSSLNSTLQIFSQTLDGGPAAPLFDEAADCTAPHPSPDGKSLAYLSFRKDATGDICVRDLATLTRRCLTDADTTELDLLWTPSSDSIIALSRPGLHDDVELDRVYLSGRSTQSLLFRDLSSPVLSPDARWLAYIPTARDSEIVGPGFASRAMDVVALQRFDQLRTRPLEVKFDLPGLVSFPMFSADGRWLYFAQYLDDTNLDGVIDGRDQSTLFRVPFDGAAAEPVRASDRAHPAQLTSVAWNCQYAAPGPIASDRLITTCSMAGTLDVYSLPLEGSLPAEWNAVKLREELAATSDRGERLFFAARLLEVGPSPDEESAILSEVLRLHLDRGALESATWTLGKLRANGRIAQSTIELLAELIAHRRAERALDRGQLSAAFSTEARARLARVTHIAGEGETAAFRALVRAELLDVLADKRDAVAALRSIDLARVESPLFLHLLAARAADLYGQLDLRALLLGTDRALAGHLQLDERAQLVYAERYIDVLLRGAARSQHAELIDDALRRVPADSTLGVRLALEKILDELQPGADAASVEQVRAASFELYRRATSFEQRRMIVHVTVRRAGTVDSDRVLYDLSNAWVSLMKRGTAERRYAERLYRDVVLERAYLELRAHKLADARGRFFGVTLQTESFEAWTGFLSLRGAESPAQARSELEARAKAGKDDPVLRFGHALLAIDAIAKLTEPAQRLAKLDEAIVDLKVASFSASRSTELNYVWGHCLYVRYLATGDRAFAQEANTKLLLALDLASDNARYRAVITETLARVQASVGNHRIAIEHYASRDTLPFVAPEAELAHLVTQARSQQLIDHERDASATIEHAVTLAKSKPALARFLPLVLDRAALHHLAAGEAADAVSRYDELLRLLPALKLPPTELGHDRYTALLGRGAAHLVADRAKDAARDLADAEALFEQDPRRVTAPFPRPTDLPPDRDAQRTHRLLLRGLRAEAHAKLGALTDAALHQRRRLELLHARYKDFAIDEDLLAIAQSEAHLGEYAVAARHTAEAVSHYEAALVAAERFAEKSGTAIFALRFELLEDLAQLHAREHTAHRKSGKLDLAGKIDAVLVAYAKQRNPAFATHITRLERERAALVLEQERSP